MKLHEDRYAFLTIINLIHEISGIRSDILEKGYYGQYILGKPANGLGNRAIYQPAAP